MLFSVVLVGVGEEGRERGGGGGGVGSGGERRGLDGGVERWKRKSEMERAGREGGRGDGYGEGAGVGEERARR